MALTFKPILYIREAGGLEIPEYSQRHGQFVDSLTPVSASCCFFVGFAVVVVSILSLLPKG